MLLQAVRRDVSACRSSDESERVDPERHRETQLFDGRDVVTTVEIGDRSRNSADPTYSSRRKPPLTNRVLQDRPRPIRQRSDSIEFYAIEGGIGFPRARNCAAPGSSDPFGNLVARFASGITEQLGGRRALDADSEVESIEERPRDASVIASSGRVAASTRSRSPGLTAWTRIHRGNQQDIGGISGRTVRPRYSYLAFLQRLTKAVERRRRKLSELVEEEHPAMGE